MNGFTPVLVIDSVLVFHKSQPSALDPPPGTPPSLCSWLISHTYLPPVLHVVGEEFNVPGLFPGDTAPPEFTVNELNVPFPFTTPPASTVSVAFTVPLATNVLPATSNDCVLAA